MARKKIPPFSLPSCRIGFEVPPKRIEERGRGRDRTLEIEPRELRAARRLGFRELDVGALRRLAKRNHVLYDIKYVFGRADTDGRL